MVLVTVDQTQSRCLPPPLLPGPPGPPPRSAHRLPSRPPTSQPAAAIRIRRLPRESFPPSAFPRVFSKPGAFLEPDPGRPTCPVSPAKPERLFGSFSSSFSLFPGNPSLWVPSYLLASYLGHQRAGLASQLDRGALLGIANKFTEHQRQTKPLPGHGEPG